MGRKIMRVPLNFSWPLKKTWKGYLNPYAALRNNCPDCGGTGSSPRANLYEDEWYGKAGFDPVAYGSDPVLTIDSPVLRRSVEQKLEIGARVAKQEGKPDYWTGGGAITKEEALDREIRRMFEFQRKSWMNQLRQDDVDALVKDGRLIDLTSDFIPGVGWQKKSPEVVPTAAQVNEWSFFGFGHDCINQWVCVKARCDREGVDPICSKCEGYGDLWYRPEHKKSYEDGQPEDPPSGDGWQVWETVSEGSPITPVFKSASALAAYCAIRTEEVGGSRCKMDYAGWLKFINAGWAPSLVMDDQGARTGVEAVGTKIP